MCAVPGPSLLRPRLLLVVPQVRAGALLCLLGVRRPCLTCSSGRALLPSGLGSTGTEGPGASVASEVGMVWQSGGSTGGNARVCTVRVCRGHARVHAHGAGWASRVNASQATKVVGNTGGGTRTVCVWGHFMWYAPVHASVPEPCHAPWVGGQGWQTQLVRRAWGNAGAASLPMRVVLRRCVRTWVYNVRELQ